MKNKFILKIGQELAEQLREINYEMLPISDYNKQYISTLKPAFHYYIDIYSCCLKKALEHTSLSPKEMTMVDYGGGSGFLSILAKKVGFGKVIYLDINPQSVETASLLKEKTGTGADIFLQGDSIELKEWCLKNQVKPNILIATDLIEHIYDLNSFFYHITSISEYMVMIFTTASNPYNPYIKYRLRKMMKGCEKGIWEIPNYYIQREKFIHTQKPEMDEKELRKWSEGTRGLIFKDILKALNENVIPVPEDSYNTCDPETGNWTERILPINRYRNILRRYEYAMTINKGFYNTKRQNKLLNLISYFLNCWIKFSGKAGLVFSLFLIFNCCKNN